MYAVLKVYKGDWSNGMTEVSKTFSGSSILSSPARNRRKNGGFFFLVYISCSLWQLFHMFKKISCRISFSLRIFPYISSRFHLLELYTIIQRSGLYSLQIFFTVFLYFTHILHLNYKQKGNKWQIKIYLKEWRKSIR